LISVVPGMSPRFHVSVRLGRSSGGDLDKDDLTLNVVCHFTILRRPGDFFAAGRKVSATSAMSASLNPRRLMSANKACARPA
jgi:hypothetical protein